MRHRFAETGLDGTFKSGRQEIKDLRPDIDRIWVDSRYAREIPSKMWFKTLQQLTKKFEDHFSFDTNGIVSALLQFFSVLAKREDVNSVVFAHLQVVMAHVLTLENLKMIDTLEIEALKKRCTDKVVDVFTLVDRYG